MNLKGSLYRLKSVTFNKMVGDDDHATYAGMSHIYTDIYASRTCEMIHE